MKRVYEKCVELPQAIVTSDGQLMKGTKSYTTKVLEKRYENAIPKIMSTELPSAWVPHTTIVEGMFLINITPWSAHQNMVDHAESLLRQHILPHFRNGSKEVHLLFDDPDCTEKSPKYFERIHRDHVNPTSDDHHCSEFSRDLAIPSK